MSRLDLSKLDIIIAGQILTGRIEVIEGYLKERANALVVLGYPGAFSHEFGRCTIYRQGKFVREVRTLLSRLRIRTVWIIQPLIFFGYVLGLLSILYSTFRLGKRFHAFVGVGSFATLQVFFLKKLE